MSLEGSSHNTKLSHASHLFQVTVALAERLEFRVKSQKIKLYMSGVSSGHQHLLINLKVETAVSNPSGRTLGLPPPKEEVCPSRKWSLNKHCFCSICVLPVLLSTENLRVPKQLMSVGVPKIFSRGLDGLLLALGCSCCVIISPLVSF